MASQQKSAKSAKILHLSTISVSFSANAGMKAQFPVHDAYIVTLYNTMVTEVNAIVAIAYHS